MTPERILMRLPSESAEAQRAVYQKAKPSKLLLAEMAEKEGGRKNCFLCQGEKPLSEFYKHPQMADGHLGKCKECTRLGVKSRYYTERKKIRDYEKWRFGTNHRKSKLSQYTRNSRAKNPEKYQARTKLGNAIRDGKIQRKPCEICGRKAEGHHRDYLKPLEVQWLCFKHHREIGHGQIVDAKDHSK